MFSKSFFPGIYFNSVLQLGKAHQNLFEISFFLKQLHGDISHISYNLPIKENFQYIHRCLSITTINFRTYLLLQKETHALYPSPSVFLYVQPQATTDTISVSYRFAVLDIFYKWKYEIYGLLFLTFLQQNVKFIHAVAYIRTSYIFVVK